MKFIVALEEAEEGGFNVSVPALDGCFTQGEIEEEALANAQEAIVLLSRGTGKIEPDQSHSWHDFSGSGSRCMSNTADFIDCTFWFDLPCACP